MEDFNLAEQLLDDQQETESDIIKRAIEASKIDPGAVYEPEILGALREVSALNPADYARYRAEFKNANKDNSVVQLDKLVNKAGETSAVDSKADELVELLQTKGTFFHNQDKESFVTFEQDDHIESLADSVNRL
jgi:hypothetical protein